VAAIPQWVTSTNEILTTPLVVNWWKFLSAPSLEVRQDAVLAAKEMCAVLYSNLPCHRATATLTNNELERVSAEHLRVPPFGRERTSRRLPATLQGSSARISQRFPHRGVRKQQGCIGVSTLILYLLRTLRPALEVVENVAVGG
jgi:hypothetical protein